MNALKFQQDALTAYMRKPDDKRTVCWAKEGEHVLLILHAAVGLLLKLDDMVLDTKKLNDVTGFDGVQRAKRSWVEGNLLTPTEEYRLCPGNKKIRIYQARAWRTGIDQSLLKYFDLATMKLYQQEEKGIILITEKGKGFEDVVGIVLPCRI